MIFAACIDVIWGKEGCTHQPLQEQEAWLSSSSQKSKGSLFGQGLSVTCLQVNAKRILITNRLIKSQGNALLYRHDNLYLSKQELSSLITLTDRLWTFALLNSQFFKTGCCAMTHIILGIILKTELPVAVAFKYSLTAVHVVSLMLVVLLQSCRHGSMMKTLLMVNYLQCAGSNTTTKKRSLAGVWRNVFLQVSQTIPVPSFHICFFWISALGEPRRQNWGWGQIIFPVNHW